jgi:hypothetical protein
LLNKSRPSREQWRRERLCNFDNAAESVADSPMLRLNEDGSVREGFLKFFVAILKDYKR